MGRLEGMVAAITGAGSGMGKAMAILFAAEGAKVACVDRSGAQDEVAASIGPAAIGIQADVAVSAQMKAMFETVEAEFGRLDILVNNAGYGGPRALIVDQTEEVFDDVVAVNMKGVFLGMKYGIAAMLRSGGGSVINIASTLAVIGFPEHAVYGGAKGAVVQMSKSVAIDYGKQGIRVNVVCPHMTWTALVPGSGGSPVPPPGYPPPPNVALERWGLAGDIANAVLFFASDDSAYVTGTVLPVDGGFLAS